MYIGNAIIRMINNIIRLKTAQSVTLNINKARRIIITAKKSATNIDPNSLKIFFIFQK